jgi:hypothetical protein
MLRDVFRSLGGFESYGLISMVIFLVFFAMLLLHTLTLKRKDVEDFSRMPLDDKSNDSQDNQDL